MNILCHDRGRRGTALATSRSTRSLEILLRSASPVNASHSGLTRGIRPIENRLRNPGTTNHFEPVQEWAVRPNIAFPTRPVKIKILLLGSSPSDALPIGLTREARQIESCLRNAGATDHFELAQEWAVRPTDLQSAFLRHQPDIVHVSGHGNECGEICLENEHGRKHTVPVTAMARLLWLGDAPVRCALFNTCYSRAQAIAACTYTDVAIGMAGVIDDQAAIAFASAFYQALAHRKSVAMAHALGCNQIELIGAPGHDLPKLFARAGVDPTTVTFP